MNRQIRRALQTSSDGVDRRALFDQIWNDREFILDRWSAWEEFNRSLQRMSNAGVVIVNGDMVRAPAGQPRQQAVHLASKNRSGTTAPKQPKSASRKPPINKQLASATVYETIDKLGGCASWDDLFRIACDRFGHPYLNDRVIDLVNQVVLLAVRKRKLIVTGSQVSRHE